MAKNNNYDFYLIVLEIKNSKGDKRIWRRNNN